MTPNWGNRMLEGKENELSTFWFKSKGQKTISTHN